MINITGHHIIHKPRVSCKNNSEQSLSHSSLGHFALLAYFARKNGHGHSGCARCFRPHWNWAPATGASGEYEGQPRGRASVWGPVLPSLSNPFISFNSCNFVCITLAIYQHLLAYFVVFDKDASLF